MMKSLAFLTNHLSLTGPNYPLRLNQLLPSLRSPPQRIILPSLKITHACRCPPIQPLRCPNIMHNTPAPPLSPPIPPYSTPKLRKHRITQHKISYYPPPSRHQSLQIPLQRHPPPTLRFQHSQRIEILVRKNVLPEIQQLPPLPRVGPVEPEFDFASNAQVGVVLGMTGT